MTQTVRKHNFGTLSQFDYSDIGLESQNDLSNFYWNLPNKPNILSLLCESHHLNRERVETNVDKLILNYEKCKKHHQTMKKQPSSVQLTLDTMVK